MNTFQHLVKVLPSSGLKVLATMRQRTDLNGNPVYKSNGEPSLTTWHKTYKTVEELANALSLQSGNGHPLYMAMGGFDPKRSFVDKEKKDGTPYKGFSRNAEFTCAFRAFWLDLDVGEDKAAKGEGYIDQDAALQAVNSFVEDLELPQPMLVNSGRGVHVYWSLTEDVDQGNWWKVALILDGIVKHYGLLVDPSCTQDRARILRPIGTVNHKNGKVVSLISDAPSVDFLSFAKSLVPYYKQHKQRIEELKVKPVSYTDRSDYKFDNKPKVAKYVMKRCQVANYACCGDEPVSEPVWRGLISLLRLTTNGYKHIETLREHNKSRFPHTTRFDEDRTAEKLNWLEQRDMGPFLCRTFQSECPKLCEGCPYANTGEIKTPLTLGEHYEEIEVPQYNIEIGAVEYTPKTEVEGRADESTKSNGDTTTATGDSTRPRTDSESDNNRPNSTTPQPPYPYKRTAHGLVIAEGEREVVFFRGDCFPVMTRFVEYVDGEKNYLVKFMLRVGLTGDLQEVTFPMKDWYAADRLKQKLGSVGVSIAEKDMQQLIGYLRKYLGHVSDDMDEVKQLQHFGWADDKHQFLLGNRLFRESGAVTVQPHLNIKNYARYFKKSGSLAEWKKLMQRLSDLGAVEQQICMLSSFGSTLMKFTNYNGIWLHLMTKPGYGKTTTQEMMNGIWGDPQGLLLNAKDTLNAIEERFGRWANVGVTIDELSNLDPMIASELLLGVTQGRTKQRLDTNMRERVNDLSWQLMVLSSGNFSLIDRINTRKEDVAAEISRTLEFQLPKPTLSVYEGEMQIKKPIRDNYGVAGEEWLSHIVKIPAFKIEAMIEKVTEAFSEELNAKSDERFWITACAVMYVAGRLTNKIGLTNWDMNKIFFKLCDIVKANRVNRVTFEFSATDVLASFLAENQRNTVVTDTGLAEGTVMVKMHPSGALNVRYEQDTGLIYVRTQALKEYCTKRNLGINSVKDTLQQRNLLERSSARVVMSKGLPLSTGRVGCLVVRVDDITKATLDSMLERLNE